MNPFQGKPHSTVHIDVSSVTQRVLVSNEPVARTIRAHNDGSATVLFEYGDATVTAVLANSQTLPAGAVEVQSVPAGPIYAAVIAAGSTGSVYFTPGQGD